MPEGVRAFFDAFFFEAVCTAIAVAAITAGLAVLFTPQGWIAKRIPVVGDIIEGMRQAVAVVLIAIGCLSAGAVGGYRHRASFDQTATLRAQLRINEALRGLSEDRNDAFKEARDAAEQRVEELEAAADAREKQNEVNDEKSRAHDADSCLAADGVSRLNSQRRGSKGRR